jgi:hypothetical protein
MKSASVWEIAAVEQEERETPRKAVQSCKCAETDAIR